MAAFGCCLWWFLLGLLLGWLLNWLMGRLCRSMCSRGSAAPRAGGLYYSESSSPAPDSAMHKLINTRFYPAYQVEELPASVVVAGGGESAARGAIDVAAARTAGFAIEGPDDLTVVEGIGPKIAELLLERGITTFAQLAAMTPEAIKAILEAAGPKFKLATPQTWPEQAAMAAQNRWADLKAYQDQLVVGRPVD
jgi:predicted flap endonuclease-1-like 5' DNA nuclease